MFRIIRLLLASALAVAVFPLVVQSAHAASLPPFFRQRQFHHRR